jgi:hypothetical protein
MSLLPSVRRRSSSLRALTLLRRTPKRLALGTPPRPRPALRSHQTTTWAKANPNPRLGALAASCMARPALEATTRLSQPFGSLAARCLRTGRCCLVLARCPTDDTGGVCVGDSTSDTSFA